MDELERIKMKKMRELEEAIQRKKELLEKEEKFDIEKKRLLNKICENTALEYLQNLNKQKPETASEIENLLVQAVLLGRLRTIVSRLDIMALERKIEGKEPGIKVKRRGKETVDLSSVLKKKI